MSNFECAVLCGNVVNMIFIIYLHMLYGNHFLIMLATHYALYLNHQVTVVM
jgi:hypothetical protein